MPQKKSNKSKIIIGLTALIAVIAVAVLVVAIVSNSGSNKSVAEQLELAKQYLTELNYEAAIAAYEEAIAIEPKCEEAYLGLAEVYVAMGEYDQAIAVLEEGYDATGSSAMLDRIAEIEELQSRMSPPDFVSWEDAGLTDRAMDWQDANLEAAMREVTGIADGDIMLSDVWEIEGLNLMDKGIQNISALGSLVNLNYLHLRSNQISDISALSGMTKLETLNLTGNPISSVSALSGLTSLQRIEIRETNITDISPISFVPDIQRDEQ